MKHSQFQHKLGPKFTYPVYMINFLKENTVNVGYLREGEIYTIYLVSLKPHKILPHTL